MITELNISCNIANTIYVDTHLVILQSHYFVDLILDIALVFVLT